jgi:type I restriction enzyme S subunit
MAGKLLETTVGEVCQVFDGPHATPTRLDAGPVFLGITSLNKGRIDLESSDHVSEEDFTKWTRRVTPRPGDVVFSYETKLGEAAVIPEGLRCCLGRRMGLMRPDPKKLDSRFLLFYYLGPEFQEVIRERTIHGSTVDRLALIEFPRFPLRIPPLAEQKAIAAVLGALDDKIELNRRMNGTLEAMARALFQSWFVDFDPVRAKLDGRQPANLDPATAALFAEHLEDSPLGHIPKGWEVSRLDEIASIMMGLSPDGESYNAEGIGMPLINGPVEFGDYFPVKTKWTEVATRFASEGDLIFCVRGSTTGRRVVSDGEYGIGRGVCAIRAKGGYNSFLYQTINVGLDRLLEKTTGSVFPSLSAPDIKGFSVLKPSKGILEAYEHTTKPLIQRIQQNHLQSRTLATLRDTLLPKLLSGELSVSSV